MAIKDFKAVSIDDAQAAKLQENVAEALVPILRSQILDGVLLRDVVLITGQQNTVYHKLGRAPLAWILASPNADTRVWESASNLPSKTLLLNCSANCTISLWVF